ncbi:MAG: NAD(P)/FAD-dependent oxidoreductase [Bacteroidales bacterium]|nr:NAD(P)/FAD-dependent oxidoreductase [Bacteroidales bacterium]
MMTYDIIIIGSGLGGLTAGAKLARSGKKVLLVEQHDRPGGCATTFKRRDFTMEVGLHEMDGLHPRDMKSKVFRDLGIFDRVEFLEVPEFYRFINERYDLVIPHDPEQAKRILKETFPGEEKGIDDYFYHVLNSKKIMIQYRDQPEKSVGQFLDEIILNDDLKLVLLGNLGYFHDDPYTLSWLYYLTAQGSYYGGRANFIKGGSQQLSNALMDIITENGGVVKLSSLVTKIDYEGKRPVGVTYGDVKGKERGTYSDRAGEIIVNAAVPNLARNLLSKADGKELTEKYANNKIGASLLTVYYGFNTPLKKAGNKHYSTFIYDTSVKSQADILENNHSDFSTRSFTFVDYSLVDSALAPEGKSVGSVCCIDYPSDWDGLSRDEYNRMKADVADTITERCEQIIPGFREAVEYVEVATSLSVKRFTLNPEGAVYGFAQNPGKPTEYLSALPDNIHLASAWGKFGGGFSGAIFSGYMTALDLLRKSQV